MQSVPEKCQVKHGISLKLLMAGLCVSECCIQFTVAGGWTGSWAT